MSVLFHRMVKLFWLVAAFAPIAAHANPLDGQVVGGNASVSGQGTNQVTINQISPHAIINWKTFNVSTGERTDFVQPNASAVTLNRVTGGAGASQLDAGRSYGDRHGRAE